MKKIFVNFIRNSYSSTAKGLITLKIEEDDIDNNVVRVSIRVYFLF